MPEVKAPKVQKAIHATCPNGHKTICPSCKYNTDPCFREKQKERARKRMQRARDRKKGVDKSD